MENWATQSHMYILHTSYTFPAPHRIFGRHWGPHVLPAGIKKAAARLIHFLLRIDPDFRRQGTSSMYRQ